MSSEILTDSRGEVLILVDTSGFEDVLGMDSSCFPCPCGPR